METNGLYWYLSMPIFYIVFVLFHFSSMLPLVLQLHPFALPNNTRQK